MASALAIFVKPLKNSFAIEPLTELQGNLATEYFFDVVYYNLAVEITKMHFRAANVSQHRRQDLTWQKKFSTAASHSYRSSTRMMADVGNLSPTRRALK